MPPQIYKNDDVDPEKMIKKKNFLEKNNVADMTELLNGEELDMAAEFNNLDNEKKEKVQRLSLWSLNGDEEQFSSSQVMFSEIITWAFKKTMKRNIAAKK